MINGISLFPSYDVNIFQIIRFARVSSHFHDFINQNKILTAKPFKQPIGNKAARIIKFVRRSQLFGQHSEFVAQYTVSLRAPIQKDASLSYQCYVSC